MFRLMDEVNNREALTAIAAAERERRSLARARRAGGAPVRLRAARVLRTLADHLDSQPSSVRVPSQRFETAE